MENENDHRKAYMATVIVLLIVTIVEYVIGFMETSALKITLLLLLSFVKATFIVAIFMHVKYQDDKKTIAVIGFLIPLLLILYLVLMIYFDFQISIQN